jgi:hypothetical protein
MKILKYAIVVFIIFCSIQSIAQNNPLVIGKIYTFYDGRNSVLQCYECDPIWDITFVDKNNAILISRMPNKKGQYGSCRSEVKYKYNPATKMVSIISISNPNVPEDCKNRFIGDWQWKKGKYLDMRFYSKNLSDCDFS